MSWFHIFMCFWIFISSFQSWSNLRFDHDLNKFKTWKWKTKPGSFLLTPKWSYYQSFVPFHDSKFKPFSWILDFIRQSWRYHIPYMVIFVSCYLHLVYHFIWLVYDIRRLCEMVSHFYDFFLNFISSFQIWSNFGLTKI